MAAALWYRGESSVVIKKMAYKEMKYWFKIHESIEDNYANERKKMEAKQNK